MNTLEKAVSNVVGLVSNSLAQNENVVEGERSITPGMPQLLRRAAAEGIVLLKNEDQCLPLGRDTRVAVFGRCQIDWFYVGYGSGGDVHPPYQVSLLEGMENAGICFDRELAETYLRWCGEPKNKANHGTWGNWPYCHPEMPLEEALVRSAAGRNDAAIVVIGRAAGEDRENILEPGSFYLTEQEHRMLRLVCAAFPKVILLMDCGNIMDLSFVRDYPIASVLYVWQLGMESGNAVADVLTGAVNPCGKLADSIAISYPDYPSSSSFGNKDYNFYEEDIFVGYRYYETFGREKLLYPFGFGLSYTSFAMTPVAFDRRCGESRLQAAVENTGSLPGKEVVQIYCQAPDGKLSKPGKVLAGYAKTRLLQPGEKQVLTLSVPDELCASFDDSGVTGFANAFVLEAGEYRLLLGNSSEADTLAGSFTLEQTKLVTQCTESCGPEAAFPVLTRDGMAVATAGSRDLRQRILDNLPQEIPFIGDQGILLSHVAQGSASLEAFVAQLTDQELGDLTRGEGPMDSKQGTSGNAGAFGGITAQLRSRGIPALITADGPAGVRLKKYTSLLPCGTALACSWNDSLVEELMEAFGAEAFAFGVDVILSPGMNIHRNPLCGRNFEYYSEDPLLCGKMAAAAVRGIQKGGVSACPKHFACNSQEVNRNRTDSRLSMRALREIYLKGFEICVREAEPQNIMTSYNKINGVWSHYNYDLVTTILRGEWGYRGNVVTDWWMQKGVSPEFPKLRNSAYRVRAQVDVLMPGGTAWGDDHYHFDWEQLESLGQSDGLTRGELQRTAMNVLRFALMRLKVRKL